MLIAMFLFIEIVEKAKEGYESSVTDLEEDDSVILKTLDGGLSSETDSASERLEL